MWNRRQLCAHTHICAKLIDGLPLESLVGFIVALFVIHSCSRTDAKGLTDVASATQTPMCNTNKEKRQKGRKIKQNKQGTSQSVLQPQERLASQGHMNTRLRTGRRWSQNSSGHHASRPTRGREHDEKSAPENHVM